MTAYGFTGGHRMAPDHCAEPPAHELTFRYRAQSIGTKNGVIPPLPSYQEAMRIIARANKPRIRVRDGQVIRVTVPQPLHEETT